jgi:hypothetical protein
MCAMLGEAVWGQHLAIHEACNRGIRVGDRHSEGVPGPPQVRSTTALGRKSKK